MNDIALITGYLVCVVGLFWFVLWIIIRTAKQQTYGDKDPKQEMREAIARWANDQPQDWGNPGD